jgi:MFS family permease
MTESTATEETPPRQSPLSRIGRALRHRNYRLFFSGQLVSLVGTFLTTTAMSWFVLELTTDPAHYSQRQADVYFAAQIPLFLLGPIAGVWVDRVDRRRLILITQTLAMLQSFALATLAFSHTATITRILMLALFQGLVNCWDIPGRQAFLLDMVTDRDDLANAIALNSTMVHFARVLGPAAAGLIIARIGIAWCFLIDALSYIAVIAALLAMILAPHTHRPPRSVRVELVEGARYVFGFPPTRALILLMAIVSLTAMPCLTTLLPIYGNHFGGNARGSLVFGFLGAATGIGALAGALMLAARRSVVGLGRLMAVACSTFALALIALAASPNLWLCLVILPFCGWGMITTFASANTILQTLADDDKRGRVMSFFSMAFIGVSPFGALFVGRFLSPMLAQFSAHPQDPMQGARRAMFVAALLCLVSAVQFATRLAALRKLVLPVYVSKGILPEVASGLQVATEITDPAEA